jgi:soluble epoxide hydrolase/lipid-phosphate phosphatase
MDAFEKKTLKTSRGYTYTYYTADGDKSLPTLFFQHGWPDHAEMWKDVATSLRSTKHPIIIPDLLGYDGTDKPTDPAEYRFDGMTKDLMEIIDTEEAEKVISIGHDWGSTCAARLYNYHPSRVSGMVLLNVAYQAPSRKAFDLDAVNQMTAKVFGYPIFSYWYLFTSADGPQVLNNNIERLFYAMHGTADTLKYFFTGDNALREFLTNGNGGKDIELRPYAKDPAFKQAFIDRMTRDGFEGPLCWYKAATQGIHHESDKNLPEAVATVEVPLLYIGATEDPVCRPEGMYAPIQAGLLPKVEQPKLVEAAHWTPYEAPQDVARDIESWLKKHFAQ